MPCITVDIIHTFVRKIFTCFGYCEILFIITIINLYIIMFYRSPPKSLFNNNNVIQLCTCDFTTLLTIFLPEFYSRGLCDEY